MGLKIFVSGTGSIKWGLCSCLLGLLFLFCACENKDNGKNVFLTAGNWRNPPAFHGNPWIDSGRGTHESFIYEPLFLYVPANETFIPRLGLSFTESEDLKSLKITLRPEVFWHDGTPFSSADIRTTFLVWYLQNWGGNLSGIEIEETKENEGRKNLPLIETPDPHTVIFNWFQPCTTIDKIQLLTELVKLPAHIYGQWAIQAEPFMEQAKKLHQLRSKRDPYAEPSAEELKLVREIEAGKAEVRNSLYRFRPPLPVGTGPFQIVRVSATDISLQRFEKSWCRDSTDVDGVRILKWPGNEAIWAYLLAGEVDAVAPATPPDVTREIMKVNPRMKLITPVEYAEFGFICNLKRPPLDDIAFRRAIAHAIDRDLIRKISYYYADTVANYNHGVVNSLSDRWLEPEFVRTRLTAYNYDPELAKKLLIEAGYLQGEDGFFRNRDGSRMKLEIIGQAGASDWILGAENLSSQLQAIGIETELRARDGAIYGSILSNGEFSLAAEFGTDYRRFAHPATSFTRYFGNSGFIRYCSSFPQTVSGPDGREVDLQKSVDLLYQERNTEKLRQEVQKLAWIANENLPFLTIYEKKLMIFVQDGKRVSGWPEADDPLWSMASGGIEKLYTYLLSADFLKGVRKTVVTTAGKP
jgi:peptide/nickel transport system substrate-binding protein